MVLWSSFALDEFEVDGDKDNVKKDLHSQTHSGERPVTLDFALGIEVAKVAPDDHFEEAVEEEQRVQKVSLALPAVGGHHDQEEHAGRRKEGEVPEDFFVAS